MRVPVSMVLCWSWRSQAIGLLLTLCCSALQEPSGSADLFNCDRQCRWQYGFFNRSITGACTTAAAPVLLLLPLASAVAPGATATPNAALPVLLPPLVSDAPVWELRVELLNECTVPGRATSASDCQCTQRNISLGTAPAYTQRPYPGVLHCPTQVLSTAWCGNYLWCCPLPGMAITSGAVHCLVWQLPLVRAGPPTVPNSLLFASPCCSEPKGDVPLHQCKTSSSEPLHHCHVSSVAGAQRNATQTSTQTASHSTPTIGQAPRTHASCTPLCERFVQAITARASFVCSTAHLFPTR